MKLGKDANGTKPIAESPNNSAVKLRMGIIDAPLRERGFVEHSTQSPSPKKQRPTVPKGIQLDFPFNSRMSITLKTIWDLKRNLMVSLDQKKLQIPMGTANIIFLAGPKLSSVRSWRNSLFKTPCLEALPITSAVRQKRK